MSKGDTCAKPFRERSVLSIKTRKDEFSMPVTLFLHGISSDAKRSGAEVSCQRN